MAREVLALWDDGLPTRPPWNVLGDTPKPPPEGAAPLWAPPGIEV